MVTLQEQELSGIDLQQLLRVSAAGIRASTSQHHKSSVLMVFQRQQNSTQKIVPAALHDPQPAAYCGLTPSINNVVSTASVGRKLDLKQIVLMARNAEFNPRRFSAVIMRIREPKATASIFSTGKMVCVGAKSVEHSRTAMRKFARIIAKLQPGARFMDFRVRNIMATSDVKFKLMLESLSCVLSNFSTYEPELFPGLFYRMRQPKLTIGLFVSGKITIAGAKDENQIDEALKKIYPILTPFRKLQLCMIQKASTSLPSTPPTLDNHVAAFDGVLSMTKTHGNVLLPLLDILLALGTIW
ncbi:hypothetical protein GOP47_0029216 [Adiantum capillus-veneris]|nr:hypothetical protein GOP47_0029216 [Adiantum capillus-veneris]